MSAITVATYNAHSWYGTDGRRDPRRTVRVLNELRADLIALQEIVLPAGGHSGFTLTDLTRATGMTAIPGPTFRRADSEFGNVLLSRRPLRDFRLIDISVEGREPRGAIVATVAIEARFITVIATHLGLRGPERRKQIRRLMAEAPQPSAGPVIMMGDFNEWRFFGPGLAILNARFGRQAAAPSYPSFFPLLALDRIFVDPRVAQREIRVVKTRLARRASDHLPVRGTIRFQAPPA
jgi:endonuclease/exonuclease/phosphatase family metal-dependent hydrolase